MAHTIHRYTNIVEHRQSTTLTAVDDTFAIHAGSGHFLFAVKSQNAADFKVCLETSFTGTVWKKLNPNENGVFRCCDDDDNDNGTPENIQINAAGEYEYTFANVVSNHIRVRIHSIASGTPSVLCKIGVVYQG